jgi:hypothetical protein
MYALPDPKGCGRVSVLKGTRWIMRLYLAHVSLQDGGDKIVGLYTDKQRAAERASAACGPADWSDHVTPLDVDDHAHNGTFSNKRGDTMRLYLVRAIYDDDADNVLAAYVHQNDALTAAEQWRDQYDDVWVTPVDAVHGGANDPLTDHRAAQNERAELLVRIAANPDVNITRTESVGNVLQLWLRTKFRDAEWVVTICGDGKVFAVVTSQESYGRDRYTYHGAEVLKRLDEQRG